jgi:hypothetical protein
LLAAEANLSSGTQTGVLLGAGVVGIIVAMIGVVKNGIAQARNTPQKNTTAIH